MADPDTERAAMTSEQQRVEEIAGIIWRETYRHDTLMTWHEVKRGTMHHKRVIAAAKTVQAHLRAKEGV